MPRPSWTIYGRRRAGVSRFDGRPLYAAVHGDGFQSEADATLWLMDQVLEHGAGTMNVVVVRLDNGRDRNGERHVIRRIGDGKAWWE